MKNSKDIRWVQRFQSYSQAFLQLEAAVVLSQQRALSDLEKQGLIQAFETQHELAWNVLKDYFEFQGTMSITGSRDAAREAFHRGLVQQGEVWMEMIKSRNQTSHTYNKTTADQIVHKILNSYFSEFAEFKKTFSKLASHE